METTLKALLQEREIRFSRTHDLVELASLLRSDLPALAEHEPALHALTECAVEARHPGRAVTPSEAEAAIRTMDAVRALVLAALGIAGGTL